MGLIDKLRDTQDFTASEKEIAAYLLSVQDEIPSLTLQRVIKETHSNNASISRFCKKMGFGGFKELQARYEAEKEEEAQAAKAESSRRGESSGAILRSMSELMRQTSIDRYGSVEREKLSAAASTIMRARRVFVSASKDLHSVASQFARSMNLLGCTVIVADDILAFAVNARRYDAVLLMGKDGAYAGDLRQYGCRIIVIGAQASEADIHITLPRNDDVSEIGAVCYEQLSLFYVLNCIHLAVYARIV